ncbi:GNAT family N-acetyltransferase [Candidatus Acetothermia bacterium]|nr:GNAT family N-acetyltransferase [Candidatus Acetothermia bacterium]MBI3643506.1 GNAT family N-acetyltransferase [Candidatus Acetothermia bacterium]
MNEFQIYPAGTANDLASVRELFQEYADSLPVEVLPEDFQSELQKFPQPYVLPEGLLLIAKRDEEIAGCIALRKFSGKICEMKRLYVRQEFRGHSLGRRLAVAIIQQASELGYSTMRLDTLPAMKAAIALYHSLGFIEIEPYFETKIQKTIFMGLDLKV